MYTIDKIKANVGSFIIEVINDCANQQKIDILEKWLTECNEEIALRQELKQDTYPLFYEQTYLKMVLEK